MANRPHSNVLQTPGTASPFTSVRPADQTVYDVPEAEPNTRRKECRVSQCRMITKFRIVAFWEHGNREGGYEARELGTF